MLLSLLYNIVYNNNVMHLWCVWGRICLHVWAKRLQSSQMRSLYEQLSTVGLWSPRCEFTSCCMSNSNHIEFCVCIDREDGRKIIHSGYAAIISVFFFLAIRVGKKQYTHMHIYKNCCSRTRILKWPLGGAGGLRKIRKKRFYKMFLRSVNLK